MDNIDIDKIIYTRVDETVTIQFIVKGEIEDRGQTPDYENYDSYDYNVEMVQYQIILQTSESIYTILYMNQTCNLTYTNATTYNEQEIPFSINQDTLEVTFTLENEDEIYQNISATTNFVLFDFTNIDVTNIDYEDMDDLSQFFSLLFDEVSDIPLDADIYGYNDALVGNEIDFQPFVVGGIPPYSYKWNFGDGKTSTERLPSHAYDKQGQYTVTLTVTDDAGATDTFSVGVSILPKEENGENGNTNIGIFDSNW